MNTIWVCIFCGARSNDRYGLDKIDAKYCTDHECGRLAAHCKAALDEEGNFVLVESAAEIQKRVHG